MKISELQKQLEIIAQNHGDVPIIFASRYFSQEKDVEFFSTLRRLDVEYESDLTMDDYPGQDIAVLRDE